MYSDVCRGELSFCAVLICAEANHRHLRTPDPVLFAGVRVNFQTACSLSINFFKIRKYIYVLKMLIVRLLGTLHSSFPKASIRFSGRVF